MVIKEIYLHLFSSSLFLEKLLPFSKAVKATYQSCSTIATSTSRKKATFGRLVYTISISISTLALGVSYFSRIRFNGVFKLQTLPLINQQAVYWSKSKLYYITLNCRPTNLDGSDLRPTKSFSKLVFDFLSSFSARTRI